MLRFLPIAAATFSLLLLAGAGNTPGTSALVVPDFECDGKMGLVANPGNDPFLWPVVTPFTVDLGPENQQGQQDIVIGGSGIIPVTGLFTRSTGAVVGTGSGVYSIFQTDVRFDGDLTLWPDNTPKWLSGEYQLRGESTPFPNNNIHLECPGTTIPVTPGDTDSDGVFNALHFPLTYTTQTTATVSLPPTTDLLVRKFDSSIQTVTLDDPADWSLFETKSGPMEAVIDRMFAIGTELRFGGAVDATQSTLGFNLPTVLGGTGSPVIRQVSGYAAGEFYLNPTATSVSDLEFHSTITGDAFPFLGGQADSGPWTLSYDQSQPLTYDFNPAAGTYEMTLFALFRAANLGVEPAQQQSQPAGFDEVGDPIPFEFTVSGTFPSFTPLASALDNCPDTPNADQLDSDADGIGDACQGVVWVDPTCDGAVAPEDGLDTALRLASLDLLPRGNGICRDYFADMPFGFEWGDWDCSGALNEADILVPLRDAAGIEQPSLPAGVPGPCPQPGDFILLSG